MLTCAICFILVMSIPLSTKAAINVTNEDIRDAILQVVNVVRSIEDKLERHEYRERNLGEPLRKGIISIDKRIKLLDPFKGTMHRIDERLAAVETILMQKDERERIQLQKTFDTVEDIQANFPHILEKLKDDIITNLSKKTSGNPKGDSEKLHKELLDKINKVTDSIDKMQHDLEKIKDDNNNLREINNKSAARLDQVKRQLDTGEELLVKYENKLAEYNKISQSPADYKEIDWKNNFQQALEVQKSHVEQILSDVKGMSTRINKLPNKNDMESANNATLQLMQVLQNEPKSNDQNVAEKIRDDCNKNRDEVLKSINSLSEVTESLTESMAKSYELIKNEIQGLGKGEQVMMQTADSVLDTKRRVEYGVHQILAEVTQLIKTSTERMSDAINERFDAFELSVLDEDNGALANLTSKIGEEIDQVWRQIGIMHQQMSTSADTLTKLQNQTDSYVNGSLDVMDSMKGKVGVITGRMAEVDENLNYLLGRLSLVTQEFNQIKTGLSKALDEIRGSFKAVENKINETGPGPHNITQSNEIDSA